MFTYTVTEVKGCVPLKIHINPHLKSYGGLNRCQHFLNYTFS